MEAQNIATNKQKVATIVSYVINVLSIIIMLFAVFIVVTSLTSKDRGYTSYFGKAFAVVQSNSMAEDLSKWDNFSKGDLICFNVLSEKDKLNLEVGTVVTFWDNNISSTRQLNTHRIYDRRDSDGDGIYDEYSTKGDHNLTYDKNAANEQLWRPASEIQGTYAGKATTAGHVLTYLQGPTGFAVFIVIPCVLIMIYCGVRVVLSLMRYSKEKAIMQHTDDVDALKAELKAQLLQEMAENENKDVEENAQTDDVVGEDNSTNENE